MHEKRELLSSKKSFVYLESFRHALNGVEYRAEFFLECSQEFLVYVDKLRDVPKTDSAAPAEADKAIPLGPERLQRPALMVKNTKRHRL